MAEDLAELAAAVDALVVPIDRAALVEAFALRSRLEAKLAAAVGVYEAAHLHDADGAASMRAWLTHDAGASARDAGRLVAVGRFIRAVPEVGDAWTAGRLSSGHVEVIVHGVGRHRARFAEHAAALVPLIEALDVQQTGIFMAEWRRRADALDERHPDDSDHSTVNLSQHADGQWALSGDLGPTLGACLERALAEADSGDLGTPFPERRAAALGTIARHFLDHHDSATTRRHRPHVALTFDAADLGHHFDSATWDDGTPADRITAAWLSCDCTVHRVVRAGSVVLDHGRAVRSIPAALFQALALRDHGCRWPGCDRPLDWCEGHHLWHWEDGGPTNLDNLVLLCGHHHRVAHRRGWKLTLHQDGTLDVVHSSGCIETSHPPDHIQHLARTAHERPPPAHAVTAAGR